MAVAMIARSLAAAGALALAGAGLSGQPGRDVGGNHGQLGVGARSERLGDSLVELILGYQAVDVGGLERVDHALAVGVGRPQATTAIPRCHLVLQPGPSKLPPAITTNDGCQGSVPAVARTT